jgi:hypothetical protein
MKVFILSLFAITYYYQTVGQVFYCKIKYQREGSSEIQEKSCLFDKNYSFKQELESIEGEEVILVKVKEL